MQCTHSCPVVLLTGLAGEEEEALVVACCVVGRGPLSLYSLSRVGSVPSRCLQS